MNEWRDDEITEKKTLLAECTIPFPVLERFSCLSHKIYARTHARAADKQCFC